MPNYLYTCSCGNEFSVFCSMKEYSPTAKCEKCHALAERKIKDLVCGDYIAKCSGFYGKKS